MPHPFNMMVDVKPSTIFMKFYHIIKKMILTSNCPVFGSVSLESMAQKRQIQINPILCKSHVKSKRAPYLYNKRPPLNTN